MWYHDINKPQNNSEKAKTWSDWILISNTVNRIGDVLKTKLLYIWDYGKMLKAFIEENNLDSFDKDFLQFLEEEITKMNIDVSDEDFLRYIEENLLEIDSYMKEHKLQWEDNVDRLKEEIRKLLYQYKNMRNNINAIENSMKTKLGVNMSFVLIDLFEIAKECKTEEEFQEKREEYFENLWKNKIIKQILSMENIREISNFTNFDTLLWEYDISTLLWYSNFIKVMFPGVKDVTLQEINSIHDNVVSNIDCISPEASAKTWMMVDTAKPLFIDGKVNTEVFDFIFLDKIANFARENGMKFRMHNVIWYKDYLPVFDKLSKDELYLFLDAWMKELSIRYWDVLYAVDVLNEIASDWHPNDGILRQDSWREKLGDDYFIEVLKLARKNFPDGVELYYNEYWEERAYKRKYVMDIINKIKSVEKKEWIILLDWLGIQSHYDDKIKDWEIRNIYSDYSKLGKKLQVTEFDVSNDGKDIDFDYQANRIFRTVLDCAATNGIELFNLWWPSSKISYNSGKVNCYLDDNWEISPYAEKLIKAYSGKYKKRKNNDVV